MEQNNFEKRQNRNLLIVGIICLVGIIGIVGYTYSFFQVEDKDTGTITGTVASASLSVEVEKLAPSTEKNLVPQLDTAIEAAVVGTQGNCIDDNENAVCQVYSITVQNTSSMTINVDGLVELSAGSNPNLKWAEITGYTENTEVKPTVVSGYNSHTTKTLTANETYAANETKTYYIVVWISETGYVQADTGDFTGVVTFKLSDDESPALTTLYALGIAPNNGTPNFAKASYSSCSSTDCENTVGVYSSEDDLGTSYYFRGDVDNNYVLFDNKYWRIIRINGDGSVRVIYDGTSAHVNGESSTDRRVTTSAFNSNYADNAFVGYMNGTTDGTNFPNGTTNSVSYTEAHTNTTDSTIKAYLEDTWYPTISEANRTHIVDAIYCNDREVLTANSIYTGDGSAKTMTWYKAAERLVTNASNATPILTCSQPNDRFTLESSNFEIETNGKLDAPVGLITADEMVLAGGTWNAGNSKYYLYSGHYYWTMSPQRFSGSYAYAFLVYSSGNLYSSYVVNDRGVRPVLSLSSSALTAGTGKIDDPFRISS